MTDNKALFTLNEYLEGHQINLDRSKKHKLASSVAQAYKDMYQEEPTNAYRPNDKGKSIRIGKGYPMEFITSIKEALKCI